MQNFSKRISGKQSLMACLLLYLFTTQGIPAFTREAHQVISSSQACIPEPMLPREEGDSSKTGNVYSGERGFTGYMSLGLLPGKQDVMPQTPVSLRFSLGSYFPSGWYLGAGMAVESFDPPTLPLFGDIRWHFTSWHRKPWIGTTIGYAMAISDRTGMNDKGGVSASIGAGMIFPVSTYSFIFFYWGYRYQELHSVFTEYWNEGIKQQTIFNRMEFRIGLGFR